MKEERPLRVGCAPVVLVYLRIDMPVDQEDILPAIVVVVDELGRPGKKGIRRRGNTDPRTDLCKGRISLVSEERLVVGGEGSGVEIDEAVIQVVADGQAHAGLLKAILVQRKTGIEALIFKRAIPVVDVQIVRRRIVGDQQVDFAVVIDIDESSGKAVVMVLVADARLVAHVGEGAVSIVMKEMVRLALQSAWSATGIGPAKRAVGETYNIRTRYRRMVHIEVNVARDKEIQLAVPVIIAKRSPGGPIAQRHPGLFGHIGKCAVMIVVVQPVFAIVGDINIWPAVVVVIADGHAKTPAVIGDARLGGYVSERPIMVVMKQRRVRSLALAVVSIVGRAVHQIDVEPPIVVVVNETYA